MDDDNDKKRILELSTKIEKLESKDQALDNIREMTNKRIDRLSEQIGEVKELFAVLSQEKKDTDKQITGFEKLVEKTKPEQLLLEVRSIQKQQMILEGKFDLMKNKQLKFQENFESFSEKLKVFKGEDELLKFQKRVMTELQEVERVNRNITMNASKVENHFIKIKEKVVEATTARDDLQGLKKDLLEMKDDLQKKLDSAQMLLDKSKEKDASAASAANNAGSENNGAVVNSDVDSKIDELTDVMIQNFSKLKGRIKDLEQNLGDYATVKKWVLHLAKKDLAKKENDVAKSTSSSSRANLKKKALNNVLKKRR